jgi:hypothetical protein
VPVLDEPVTSTGNNNFNALPYLEVHDRYRADAMQVLLHKPAAFLRSLESGWFCYFRPPSDLPFYFGAEVKPIADLERISSAIFYGQLYRTEQHEEIRTLFYSGQLIKALTYTGLWLVIGLPILTLWSIWQLFLPNWTKDRKILAGYLLLTILVLTFAVNTLSFQENNRYRFPLDPFFLVLLGMAITQAMRGLRRGTSTPAGRSGDSSGAVFD